MAHGAIVKPIVPTPRPSRLGNTRRQRLAVAALAACAGGLGALLFVSQDADAPTKPATGAGSQEGFELQEATVAPTTTFSDSGDPAVHFRFQSKSQRPADVQVDVVARRSDRVVRSLVAQAQKPDTTEVVRWDGRTQAGGAAPDGKYEFRVGALYGGAPKATPRTSFELTDNIFPLAAKHRYGDGFDAGRGHQGQDVFARCGSPIVVAHAGTVTFNKYDGAAGNYVVIAGDDGHDEMYAHLKRPSPVRSARASRPAIRSATSARRATRRAAICTSSTGPTRGSRAAGRCPA